jgi:type I restriction enzyme S subunit
LNSLPVPVPPVVERAQIIAAIERQLSIADEVQVQIDSGVKRGTRLRQSILKPAFEGKL